MDAIVTDASPLRVVCHRLGAALLDGWRASTDQDYARGFLDAFATRPHHMGN